MKKLAVISFALMLAMSAMLFSSSAVRPDKKDDLTDIIADSGEWKLKIDEKLWAVINDGAQEEISILVWLDSASDEAIAARIKAEAGDRLAQLERAATIEDAQEYQRIKNEAVRTEQSKINNAFISECVANSTGKVLYAAQSISSVYMTATKADIELYAKSVLVKKILYNNPDVIATND